MKIFKVLFCFLVLSLFYSVVNSTAQVTSNVYTRVLKIQVGKNTGTAFTLDVDGRQYLVTAKHVIADLKQEDSINIYRDNQWSLTPVKVLRCEEPIDIAVLIPQKQLTSTLPLEATSESQQIIIGQEVYFVGFPFGLYMSGQNLNADFPLAFVKRGLLSAVLNEGGATIFALDGFNNPGFSGGPIVFRDLHQTNSPLYVVGVISGFRPELSHVMTPEKIKSDDDTKGFEQWRVVELKDRQKAILKDTEQMVALNTGIVIGYSIKHAIDLIKKNPFGAKIAQ
ncbi:MAG: trypsin-like peptidase domain-containing protein [Nitrospira sp.]|nr:trypsin-like peptidase domain-containing protein [Nitrospira sp.]